MPKWMTTAAHLAPNPRLALFDPPKPRPAGPIIVTEGLLDALSALAAGYPTATLLSPSSVNGTVADRIASLHLPILIATDNDQAGRNAHAKLRRLLTERDASVSGLHIPERFNDLNDWHTAARDQWSDVIHKCGQLVRSRVNQLKDTAPSLA